MITVDLPLSGLYSCGVAHLAIPRNIMPHVSRDGQLSRWLETVEEGARMPADHPLRAIVLALDAYVDASVVMAGISYRPQREPSDMRRWGRDEENNWHWDRGDTSWSDPNAIGPQYRLNPRTENNRCTMPFPLESQPGTVAIPWGGTFSGQEVQAPQGFLTLCLGKITWHRADSKDDIRGRFTRNVFW